MPTSPAADITVLPTSTLVQECEGCRARPAVATWTNPAAGAPFDLCGLCLPADPVGHDEPVDLRTCLADVLVALLDQPPRRRSRPASARCSAASQQDWPTRARPTLDYIA